MSGKVKISELILTHAPDFCWCKSEDIFLMLEQVDEDIEYNCFKTSLYKLKEKGFFITKEDDRKYSRTKGSGKLGHLYLRVA